MRTYAIAMLAAAACGASSSATDSGLPPDGPVTGPIDAPTIDLVQLCGAAPVTFDDWENCFEKRKCQWEVGCVSLNTYRDVQECLDLGDEVVGGQRSAERRERQRAVAESRARIDVESFSRC